MPAQWSELGDIWRQINREIYDRLRQHFGEQGFSPLILSILRTVECTPGITVSELARRTGTVKSHISTLIRRLREQGHLENRPDPDDLRLLRLYPTPAGAELMAQWKTLTQTAWSAVAAAVPNAQRAQVMASLQLLLTALRDAKIPAENP